MKWYQDPVVWMIVGGIFALVLVIVMIFKLAIAGDADQRKCSNQCAPYQARILDKRCHCLTGDGAWRPTHENEGE